MVRVTIRPEWRNRPISSVCCCVHLVFGPCSTRSGLSPQLLRHGFSNPPALGCVQGAESQDELRQIVLPGVEIGRWHLEYLGKALNGRVARSVGPALILIDPRTG